MKRFPYVGDKVRLKDTRTVWEVVSVDRYGILDFPIGLRSSGCPRLQVARREIVEVTDATD